jgi:hypothetical protein
LRLYQVGIRWPKPQTEEDQKEQSASQATSQIQVDLRPLVREELCLPAAQNSPEADGSAGVVLDGLHSAQLTHLEILPSAQDPATREPTPPTIMSTFAQLPAQTAVAMLDAQNHYQGISSIVCRWLIKLSGHPKVHPVFDQLSLKRRAVADAVQRVCSKIQNIYDVPTDHFAGSSAVFRTPPGCSSSCHGLVLPLDSAQHAACLCYERWLHSVSPP